MILRTSVLQATPMPVLSKAMDTYALRGKAIGNNIANVSTPGYNRIEVSFEEQLKEALDKKNIPGERTDANHMYLGRPEVNKINPQAYRVQDITNPGELNNVDIDMEMGKLAENQIAFNFAVKFNKGLMDDISSAIKMQRTQ